MRILVCIPEGFLKIAQGFNLGESTGPTRSVSPEGTVDSAYRNLSRPFGTRTTRHAYPNVKTSGYLSHVPPGRSHVGTAQAFLRVPGFIPEVLILIPEGLLKIGFDPGGILENKPKVLTLGDLVTTNIESRRDD